MEGTKNHVCVYLLNHGLPLIFAPFLLPFLASLSLVGYQVPIRSDDEEESG